MNYFSVFTVAKSEFEIVKEIQRGRNSLIHN